MIPAQSWMMKGMLYGLPAITCAFLSAQPSGVQIPLMILTVSTAITQTFLNAAPVRKWLNISEYPKNVRTTLDVKGRHKDADPNAPVPSQFETFQAMSGFGAAEKPTQVEQQRGGKSVLQAVREADSKRRQRLKEQEDARNRF
jgi:hypothetical protein